MTGILYKYRSLKNFRDLVDILLRNRLYAAQYQDLNDPMEGQYYYKEGELDLSIREKILGDKQVLRICSLSQVNNNELMWSHYADGQRGIAIGVMVDERKYTVRPIEYSGLPTIRQQGLSASAIDILSHKLKVWDYEKEVRVFVERKQYVNVHVEEIILGRAIKAADSKLIKELIGRINPDIRILEAQALFEY